MKYVLEKASMKQCDFCTITQFKVPSLVLMERAALSVCEEIQKRFSQGTVLIACGTGNNGGDGFALGRLLEEKGFGVDFLLLGEEKQLTEEIRAQMEILKAYGNKISTKLPKKEYTMIIDAIFGIGLSREITGSYQKTIQKLNEKAGYKIALDIPSGICADTGKVLGCGFLADLTVTFGYLKTGLLLYPGAEYAGEVLCRDIGIREAAFGKELPKAFTYEKEDLKRIPKRSRTGNKGSFGKLSVFAGSSRISGALLLSVLSAYRTGCGYVKAFTEESNKDILAREIKEAVIATYREKDTALTDEEMTDLKDTYAFATEVILGPGIGLGPLAEEIVSYVLKEDKKPVIVDADALTIISRNEKLQEYLCFSAKSRKFPIIFTPHPGEFARLLSKNINEVKENLLQEGISYARKMGIILVCKDARTLVINGKDGRVYINRSGNEGMATAGSGDVLTGILAGMLGRSMEPYEAACMGVFLHGLCGDIAKERNGSAYLMASDIIQALPSLLE